LRWVRESAPATLGRDNDRRESDPLVTRVTMELVAGGAPFAGAEIRNDGTRLQDSAICAARVPFVVDGWCSVAAGPHGGRPAWW